MQTRCLVQSNAGSLKALPNGCCQHERTSRVSRVIGNPPIWLIGGKVTRKPAGSLGRHHSTGGLLACCEIFWSLQSPEPLDAPLLPTSGWLAALSCPRLARGASDCGWQPLRVPVALL